MKKQAGRERRHISESAPDGIALVEEPGASPAALPRSATWRTIRVEDLHEDPANVRRHPDRNRVAVRASLREFGQVEALVVEKGTGRVIGGNCRLAELRAMGVEEVQVAEVDVHGVDATRLGLALNRTAELAEWDDSGLADLLRELSEADTLEGVGWTPDEVAALIGEASEPDEETAIEGTYAVLVTCESEAQQREVMERLDGEGLQCRAWNL